MLVWMNDIDGNGRAQKQINADEEQFSSALRAMVLVSIILFKAGYFLGFSKCSLIPEKVMTYLGSECDSLRGRFAVPEEKIAKYWPLLEKTNKWSSLVFRCGTVGG